jgi:glycosyltransferase involved in cell wall biosynthesis
MSFSMPAPGVSVIIPTYNRAALVARAVDSVLAATREGDEVIVVDDGSTDGTHERLQAYGSRIRYVRSEHIGVSAVRNLGVRESRQPLVAFLDSDDEWMPDKLELQRTVMERRADVVLCCTDFGHRSRTGQEFHRHSVVWHQDARSWNEILAPGVPFSQFGPLPPGRPDFAVHIGDLYRTQMFGDYVGTSTAVVRRSVAGSGFHFPEDLRRYDDWACFGRVCATGPVAYLDCETQWNCDHPSPRITRADPESYCRYERLTILQRVWGSDPAFLARHGDSYRRVVRKHRQALAKELLAEGRPREARRELRLLDSASPVDWTLACLPGPLTRLLVSGRRALRRRRRAA